MFFFMSIVEWKANSRRKHRRQWGLERSLQGNEYFVNIGLWFMIYKPSGGTHKSCMGHKFASSCPAL